MIFVPHQMISFAGDISIFCIIMVYSSFSAHLSLKNPHTSVLPSNVRMTAFLSTFMNVGSNATVTRTALLNIERNYMFV